MDSDLPWTYSTWPLHGSAVDTAVAEVPAMLCTVGDTLFGDIVVGSGLSRDC